MIEMAHASNLIIYAVVRCDKARFEFIQATGDIFFVFALDEGHPSVPIWAIKSDINLASNV